MKRGCLGILMLGLTVTSWPISASAVTITFREEFIQSGDQERVRVRPRVIDETLPGMPPLGACGQVPPPCVLQIVEGTEVGASVDLSVPPMLFPVPAGGVARAVLLETLLGMAQEVSDIVELRVDPSDIVGGPDRLTLSFQSDNPEGSLGTARLLAQFTVLEDGTLQRLNTSFFTGQMNDPTTQKQYVGPQLGMGLPAGYTILAQSDPPARVPEPSSLILVGAALAGLVGIAWRSGAAAGRTRRTLWSGLL